MDLSVNHGIPMGFGVLTCENYEQAEVRSSIKERDMNQMDSSQTLSSMVV